LGGEIEGTLRGGETDIGRLIQEIENEAGNHRHAPRDGYESGRIKEVASGKLPDRFFVHWGASNCHIVRSYEGFGLVIRK